MSDLDPLREMGRLVRQPAFDDLVDTRRRRTRRARLTASALAVAAIAAVGSVVATGGLVRSDQPPTLGTPDDAPIAAPRHLVEQDATPLEPGKYRISVAKDPPPVEATDVLVTVPSGFVESSDWYVVSDDGAEFLAVYAVQRVMHDACHETKNNIFTPGPTVQDLADALVTQKLSRATVPEPVTVAGHEGLYLELTGPRDITKCVKVPAGPFEGRNIYSNNQVDRLWILDVDGQRLVVDASHAAESPASDNDKLTSLVNSLEFVPSN